MANQEQNKVKIISAVKTPLGFFVLALLVIEGALGLLAGLSGPENQFLLLAGALGLIFVTIVAFFLICIIRPDLFKFQPSSTSERVPKSTSSAKPSIDVYVSAPMDSLGSDTAYKNKRRIS